MNSNSSPNVIFAVIIGTALVLGAVTFNSATERFAGLGSLNQTDTARALPDLQASTMRERVDLPQDDGERDIWRQTLVTRDTPTITISERTDDTDSYTPPDTATGRFGVSLLQPMVQSVTGEIDDTEFNQAIDSIADEAIAETLPEWYERDDVIVLNNYNDADVKTYFNSLGDALLGHLPEDGTVIQLIQERFVRHNDPSARAQLNERKMQYEALRDAVLQTPVPESKLAYHIDFINALHLLQHDFGNLLRYHEDIVIGYIAQTRQQDNAINLFQAMQNIGASVLQNIMVFDIFDQEERMDPGLLFTAFLLEEADIASLTELN